MFRTAAVLALLATTTAACGSSEDQTAPDEEQADSNEVIEFRLPDAPTEVSLESGVLTAMGQSIAYGHCDPSTTDDTGAITINCPQKWSEVAWFRISRADVEELIASGNGGLDFTLDVRDTTLYGDTVRFSVHEVAEDGSKRKVLSQPNLAHEATESIALDAIAYEIYVARGENSFLLWNQGTIEFSVSATAL